MNVRDLEDADLTWADYVFISAMIAQRNSARQVIDRCHNLGIKCVGGGPLFNSYVQDYGDVDHLVLGEAEVNLPPFIADLAAGAAKRRNDSKQHRSLQASPAPLWDLIHFRDYSSMSIQCSRGCPFNCEFCDIIIMNGRVPRCKSSGQILDELNGLYDRGWRGALFIVDDNFIGIKKRVKGLVSELIFLAPRRLA